MRAPLVWLASFLSLQHHKHRYSFTRRENLQNKSEQTVWPTTTWETMWPTTTSVAHHHRGDGVAHHHRGDDVAHHHRCGPPPLVWPTTAGVAHYPSCDTCGPSSQVWYVSYPCTLYGFYCH